MIGNKAINLCMIWIYEFYLVLLNRNEMVFAIWKQHAYQIAAVLNMHGERGKKRKKKNNSRALCYDGVFYPL